MKYIFLLLFIFMVGCSNSTNTNDMITVDVGASDTLDSLPVGNQAVGNQANSDSPDDETQIPVIVPPVAEKLINADNALAILSNVVANVNEDPIKEFLHVWQTAFSGEGHYISFPANDANTVLQTIDSGELDEPISLAFIDYFERHVNKTATEYFNYVCIGGGSVNQLVVPFIVNKHRLDDCASPLGTHSGEALRIISHHRPFIAYGHYKDLRLVDTQQKTTTLSGRFRDGGNQNFINERYTPAWIDVEFSSTQNNEPFALTRYNLARDESFADPSDFQSGLFEVSVKANFSVSADWTQHQLFSVTVKLSQSEGTLPDAFVWDTGSVLINAPDGSSITITINENNPDEFYIEFENNESIGPYLWSVGYRIKLGRRWE